MFKKMTPTKITPPESKQGKHDPKHKMSEEAIIDIKSHNQFNPSVSHYRREYAPLRKYLPPELTIREMYDDFHENGSGLIHYATYQKVVQSMNIGLGKLGEEECKTCEEYKLLEHDTEGEGLLPTIDLEKLDEKGLPRPDETCTKCKTWMDHIVKAGVARRLYRADNKRQVEKGEPISAADLEKIIMLPRLPGIKTETKPLHLLEVMVKHLVISGMKEFPVITARISLVHTSSFYPARNSRIRQSRYGRIIVQHNKNWTLFCALLHYVNQDNALQSIVMHYLEKGHTFMASDSFHVSEAKDEHQFLMPLANYLFIYIITKHTFQTR